jgi:hypothetical protein
MANLAVPSVNVRARTLEDVFRYSFGMVRQHQAGSRDVRVVGASP